ncbi:MAG TPA: DUF4340 domain-containing protein [bacterium (Candidatus Stahlbacteria)]|nr:DUF4340 domain-containing protein [Candidatus Stahlbacteria bacterium]
MKFKSLFILIGVLAALAITYFTYRWATGRPHVSKPFVQLEPYRLEIIRGDTMLVIEKKETGWEIVDPISYPADSTRVARVLRGIKDLELGAVASSRKEMHPKFEVDTVKGISIKAIGKRDSVNFILGKPSKDFTYSYVRFAHKDDVYRSKGLMQYMFPKRLDDWRDKRILSFDRNNVSEIDIVYTREKVELVRKDTVWLMNGTKVEESKVNPILTTLSNLRADGFAEEVEFKPNFQVKVKFAGGGEEVLFISGEKDKKYYAKKEGKEAVFVLSSWKVNRIKKKKADFQ